MSNYGDQYMKCPECGGTAEAESVDVGVGLYIKDEYMCDCGWNSAADGMFNVASYDDYFVTAANQNVPGARMGEAGVTVSVKVA